MSIIKLTLLFPPETVKNMDSEFLLELASNVSLTYSVVIPLIIITCVDKAEYYIERIHTNRASIQTSCFV